MPSGFAHRLLSRSLRIYALLQYAYPAEFRQRFGREMKLAFRDRSFDVIARNGWPGWFRFLIHAAADLFVSCIREAVAAGGRRALLLGILALCCSAYSVLVDAHATEVQPPLLVILVSVYALSAADPGRVLGWSLIVGGGIPAKYFASAILAHKSLDWRFLAIFLFALAAGCAGVVTNRLASSLRRL